MGGAINVAIRLKDGRTYCQERWTNNFPFYLKHPKAFEGDTEHFLAYIDMTAGNNQHGELGHPMPVKNSEYGLLVYDCMTNTILDNNGYSHPISYAAVQAQGMLAQNNNYFDFAKLGKIILNKRFYDGKEDENARLSPEDAVRLGEDEWTNNIGKSRGYWPTFYIDISPFQYFYFKEHDAKATKAYREKLKEIGFPMTKKEGLNKFLLYKDGKLTRTG